MKKNPFVLIVDDEPAISETLKSALQDEDFHVETLNDGTKALDVIGALVPDIILLDIFMPPLNGLELLEQIKQQHPKQQVIMISGFGNIPLAVQALKSGAIDFIEKPLNLDDILEKLSYLKESPTLPTQQSNDFEAYGIVGKSSLFLELMHYVSCVARLDVPHLFLGAEGSGRAMLARYVHKKSSKAHEPFEIFDCDGQKNLLEKLQKIQGTLFLKNIHALHDVDQNILLDFLSLKQNVFIMASSNSSLFDLVQNKKFSGQLFAQFQSCPVEVPSLNKRRYDIPLLVNYFIHQANVLYGFDVGITAGAVRMLRNHQWERNVAELQECLYFAVAQAPTSSYVITIDDLLIMLPEKQTSFVDEQLFCHFGSLDEATQTFQKTYLLYILKQHHYNLKKVSHLLHINISELRATIVRLGINVS